jgi:hypothetical protein
MPDVAIPRLTVVITRAVPAVRTKAGTIATLVLATITAGTNSLGRANKT